MSASRSDAPGVVGVFRDMAAARSAITTLEKHGVDAANIQLVGDAVERADVADVSGRDRNMTSYVGSRIRRTIVVGIVIGAIVGTVIGLFAPGPFWMYTLIGAGIGLAYGFFVGG